MPIPKQTWTTVAFAEEYKKVERLRRDLFEMGDPAELNFLMKGYETKEDISAQQSLMMQFIFTFQALELHLHQGGLTEPESRRVADTAERILRAANIDPSRSQLSFLYRRLYHLRSNIAHKEGRIDEGAWLVESSEHLCYRPEPSQRYEQIYQRAKFLLRMGHATNARDLILATLSGTFDDSDPFLHARCEWLAGNVKEALRLCNGDDDRLIWLGQLLNASATGEYRPFSNAVKRMQDLPSEIILSTLWLYTPAPTITRSLALRSSSLRKRFGAAMLKRENSALLIEALESVQEGYDNSIPLISRLNRIGSVFAERKNFYEIEHELVFLAAAARHAWRYSQQSLAELLLAEYKALSAKMMPFGHDALGILGDLTEKSAAIQQEQLFSEAPTKGKFARPARVAGLLGKGVTIWASAKLRSLMASEETRRSIHEQSQQQFGGHLLDLLSDLKGGFMKIGQLIASSHEISADLREPAKLLYNSASPTDPTASRLLVEQELGGPLENFFSQWNEMPFAVGSIGQVFRAQTISGEDVAVKVQHPGIEKTLLDDCASLKWIKPILQHFLPLADHDGLINEVIQRITEEADYRLEASHQMLMASHFSNDTTVVIPKVFEQLSTRKVLTSAFIEGQDFATFIEQADAQERNRAAEVIIRTVCKSFFEHNIFNADPHPGNYLFLKDGKIAFIDFGCTKLFPTKIVQATYNAAKSAIIGDKEKNKQAWIELGYVLDPENFDFTAMYQLFRTAYGPAISDKPVVFDHKLLARISAAQLESPMGRKIAPPVDTAMLLRFTWGLLSVLAFLEPELNFHQLAQEGFKFFDTKSKVA